jgi:L-ascorbate 6-phosphate lactonase
MSRHSFAANDPHALQSPIEFIVPRLVPSQAYMDSIRSFAVPPEGLAVWFFGQNGFVLKTHTGPLIAIDLYLTNSCAEREPRFQFRLDRQLPVFVEPEDLDVDIFVTTHSHQDHADPETLARVAHEKSTRFVGPWESVRTYIASGIPEDCCTLLHANQTLELGGGVQVTGTFALPTDFTDLNHLGVLIRFANGITFYDTGDTGYCELLPSLLPRNPDICAICINGGYNNLSPAQAARIIEAVNPKVAIPCHYDMMVNNVGNPEMFGVSLDLLGSSIDVQILGYYSPWLYSAKTGQSNIQPGKLSSSGSPSTLRR